MVPRSAPKATLEKGRFQDPPGGGAYSGPWRAFGAIWAILGAILAPAGRQGAHKIELFGTKSHQNLKK